MSNVIKIEQATEWTALWQRLFPNHCKAFLVPVQDLLGTLAEMGIVNIDEKGNITGCYDDSENDMIRSYLAIDPSVVEQPGNGEKLLLVGTTNTHKKDSNGNTIYRDIVQGEKLGSPSANVTLNGSGVYDFTFPCPNQCDPNSPLDHSN